MWAVHKQLLKLVSGQLSANGIIQLGAQYTRPRFNLQALPSCFAPLWLQLSYVCSAVRLSLSQRQMESAGRDSKQIRNSFGGGGRERERLGERHSGTVGGGQGTVGQSWTLLQWWCFFCECYALSAFLSFPLSLRVSEWKWKSAGYAHKERAENAKTYEWEWQLSRGRGDGAGRGTPH